MVWDASIRNAFADDPATEVVLVECFAKGDALSLSDAPAPQTPIAASDLCLVKLIVGPGHPGPAGAPSVSPGIGIEVWLPSRENWNDRIHVLGGGGWDGGSHGSANAIAELRAAMVAANEGAVSAHSDGGHPRPGAMPGQVAGGGDFAMNPDGTLNWVLLNDFASRAMHEVALKTKALANAYYGRAPKYSYFDGASNGGRQGLNLAQNHPEDFDGILADMPANNWSSFMAATVYPQLVFQRDLNGEVPSEKQQDLVSNAAIRTCDKIGEEHLGYSMDIASCRYDPTTDRDVLCVADGGNNSSEDAVTMAQAMAFNKIWYGPTIDGSVPSPAIDNGFDTKRGGKRIWYGYPRGTSLYNAIFSKLFQTNAGVANRTGPFTHGTDMLALIMQDARLASTNFRNASGDGVDGWKDLTYSEFARIVELGNAAQFELLNSNNPDLSAFCSLGGKLMTWHGIHDEAIPVQGITDYYDRVVEAMGGVDKVQSFYRLYLVPGAGHATPNGTSNPAASPPIVDNDKFYQLLVDWVEKGIAPGRIELSTPAGSPATRSQPICPYPQRATYIGGNPNVASSFECGSSR
ncbi:MAG TPA: tannase/feruloyl esterase family alpha/beta hydrolase [Steroidobacteraceae bacterium]|nr:tannase/feruloyl esterase family alpha/beta hydrolase [Steroidobacteraceae bacterium]